MCRWLGRRPILCVGYSIDSHGKRTANWNRSRKLCHRCDRWVTIRTSPVLPKMRDTSALGSAKSNKSCSIDSKAFVRQLRTKYSRRRRMTGRAKPADSRGFAGGSIRCEEVRPAVLPPSVLGVNLYLSPARDRPLLAGFCPPSILRQWRVTVKGCPTPARHNGRVLT